MNGEMVEGKRDAGALDHAGDGINIKFLDQISFRFAWLTRNSVAILNMRCKSRGVNSGRNGHLERHYKAR